MRDAVFSSGDKHCPSVPRTPRHLSQECEERPARLRADYGAEQEPRARLEEDVAAMRSSHDVKLPTLEANLCTESGERPPWAVRREASLLSLHLTNCHLESTFYTPGSVLFTCYQSPAK